MSVKIRKVGNSYVVPIPTNIKVPDTEIDVFQGMDDSIIFVPKEPNPFLDEKFINSHDFTQDELIGGELVGKEKNKK